MAVTVTTDLVNRHTMDATTNTAADGSVLGTTGQTSTTTKVQGTAANILQHKGTGLGQPTRLVGHETTTAATDIMGDGKFGFRCCLCLFRHHNYFNTLRKR